jgi:hypothetical protein
MGHSPEAVAVSPERESTAELLLPEEFCIRLGAQCIYAQMLQEKSGQPYTAGQCRTTMETSRIKICGAINESITGHGETMRAIREGGQ